MAGGGSISRKSRKITVLLNPKNNQAMEIFGNTADKQGSLSYKAHYNEINMAKCTTASNLNMFENI